MKRFLMIAAATAMLSLAACAASDKQKLLDADNSYSATQDRVLKYVTLPECDATVTSGCHDAKLKQELKDEVAAGSGATDAKGVNAVNATVSKTLADNKINCGPGAADTCP